MKRTLAGVALCTLLAGCGGNTTGELGEGQDPITGGVVDSSRPAVGALINPTSELIFCSGTLITPTRFLTAAHCVEGQTTSTLKVAFGPNEVSWTHTINVVNIAIHPDYDPSFGVTRPSDIAYVDLASAPFPAITPIPANVEGLAGREGEQWLFMGYGADRKVRGQWGGYGTKRSVQIPITTISDARGEFDYYAIDGDGNSKTLANNTCFGDSGGPAVAPNGLGVETVVGVTSRGGANCGTVGSIGIDTRVDTFASFLAGAATPPPPPPSCGDGTCNGSESCSTCEDDCGACESGGQCAACSSDADCEAGARCFRLQGEPVAACHVSCASSACPDGDQCYRVSKGYGLRCGLCN